MIIDSRYIIISYMFNYISGLIRIVIRINTYMKLFT